MDVPHAGPSSRLTLEEAATALRSACSLGARDPIRLVLARTIDSGLSLHELMAHAARYWRPPPPIRPACLADKPAALVSEDRLKRGMQWLGRYVDEVDLRHLAECDDAEARAALSSAIDAARTIRGMDERGITPSDVGEFRADRSGSYAQPDGDALVGLLAGLPIEDPRAVVRYLLVPTAAIREMALVAWCRNPGNPQTLKALIEELADKSPTWEVLAALSHDRSDTARTFLLGVIGRHPRKEDLIWLGKMDTPDAIRVLAQALPDQRWAVLGALRYASRSTAVAVLKELYREPGVVRTHGAEALAIVADEEAIGLLGAALGDRYRSVASSAAEALASLGAAALTVLSNVMRDGEPSAHTHALTALALIAAPGFGTELIGAATRGSRALRLAALSTLPATAPDRAEAVLLGMGDHRDAELRGAVLAAMAAIPSIRVVTVLQRHLRDPNIGCVVEAAQSLRRIAGIESPARGPAIAALVDAMLDENEDLRRQAHYALARLGTSARDAVDAALRDHQETRPERRLEVSDLVEWMSEPRSAREVSAYVARVLRTEDLSAGTGEENAAHTRNTVHEPATPSLSDMYVSASAPEAVTTGKACMVEIWSHQMPPAAFFATYRTSHGLQRLTTQGPVPVPSTCVLQVSLRLPGLEIAQPEATLLWKNDVAVAAFKVFVPADADAGSYFGEAAMRADGLLFATLVFQLQVTRAPVSTSYPGDCTCDVRRIDSAFASYASEDRDAVLQRVQGMQKVLPDLDVFLDVVSIRSGEDWLARLQREIMERDAFFLFWSRAARRSQWVEREWRLALQNRGIGFIDPVPLEDPSLAPPPDELASRHFNDWILQIHAAAHPNAATAVAPQDEEAAADRSILASIRAWAARLGGR